MERELTPTEIEIKKKEMYDQIRAAEEKDRQYKALLKRLPNVRIHSVRKLKRMLNKYNCHPYMYIMAVRYTKMLSCATNYMRHQKARTKGNYTEETAETRKISFYDIMREHYHLITH